MDDNVTKFPEQPKPPEWIVGPFEEWRVVIEGRMIPKLQARRFESRPGLVSFLLDNRFGLDVPEDLAYQVAHYVDTAMAIGAGYAWIGADEKYEPFAPQCSAISLDQIK